MSKTYNLTDKQRDVLTKLGAAGFKAAWWGRGEQAERLYFNGRKDVKVWIEFDEPATCRGAALKVRIDDCGQHPNWYDSQRRQIMENYTGAFQIVTGQAEAEAIDTTVTEAQAEAWRTGERVTLYSGGAPSDANDEICIVATVADVRRVPCEQIGESENVEVTLKDVTMQATAPIEYLDGRIEAAPARRLDHDLELYTWRGVLRYLSGAQPVRTAPLAEHQKGY